MISLALIFGAAIQYIEITMMRFDNVNFLAIIFCNGINNSEHRAMILYCLNTLRLRHFPISELHKKCISFEVVTCLCYQTVWNRPLYPVCGVQDSPLPPMFRYKADRTGSSWINLARNGSTAVALFRQRLRKHWPGYNYRHLHSPASHPVYM